ncbi:hypothetical protein PEPS_39630 (plasmid) [Persicobacter psychrovividus]|uniref:DUF2254 domain-containing protein n=1 Tax=Persicobacter psychrovividus TaxID=387638 RepID=A0ABN6LER3_9BACT|nr:hypothetical protein PEPS_39630 [Persicobacter psychrovividus]
MFLKAKLKYIWGLMQGSFWLVPIIIIIIGIGFACLLLLIDYAVEIQPTGPFEYFFSGNADASRTVLSIVSSAMIGLAGTVFSITLVALTLASSQFGSRLLRNFMHDRLNQVVLGTYISTYLYCLIILRTVRAKDPFTFVPNFSVLFAVFLAFGNIILLVIFIHHIAESIRADRVVADIYLNLSRNIQLMFPKDGNSLWRKDEHAKFQKACAQKYHTSIHITARQSGYLQAVDYDHLCNSVQQLDGMIRLHYKGGDFIIEGTTIAELQLIAPVDTGKLAVFDKAMVYGEERTNTQDPEYAIHQLVEIAARALSPGINDPFTAISCIDYLTAHLRNLAQLPFDAPYMLDCNQEPRVLAKAHRFDAILHAAFDIIRECAEGNPAILIRMAERLTGLREMVIEKEQAQAVDEYLGVIQSAGERSLVEQKDLEDFRKRIAHYQQVKGHHHFS